MFRTIFLKLHVNSLLISVDTGCVCMYILYGQSLAGTRQNIILRMTVCTFVDAVAFPYQLQLRICNKLSFAAHANP